MALTASQKIRLRLLCEVLGERFSKNDEETLANFEADAAPEREIQIFERVAAAFFILRRKLKWQGSHAEKDDLLWKVLSEMLMGYKRHELRIDYLPKETVDVIWETLWTIEGDDGQ